MIDDQQPQTTTATTTQTLKLESDLLVRLKIHAAMTAQTQQEIMHTALVEFLDRYEVNAVRNSTKGKTK